MVVDDMIPSEADQPTHGQQQAVLGASVIALPWVAPEVGASEAVRRQMQIGLQSDPFLRIASNRFGRTSPPRACEPAVRKQRL